MCAASPPQEVPEKRVCNATSSKVPPPTSQCPAHHCTPCRAPAALRAGEYALLSEEDRLEYLAGLRGFIKLLSDFCEAHAVAETAAEESPVDFYNKDKHGLPTKGEAMFVALLLLVKYERAAGRQLSNLIELASMENHGPEWTEPTAWRGNGGPTQQLRDAEGASAPALEAIAQVMQAEGVVAAAPDVSSLRAYVGDCNRKDAKGVPRRAGPKRKNGTATARDLFALVPAARLLADRPTRVRLMKALEAVETPVQNASGKTLPALRAELTERRQDERAAKAGERKALQVAARAGERAEAAEQETSALRKRIKGEATEAAKVVIEKWKQKRRDKAAEIRAGVHAQEKGRVKAELGKAKRRRNEANERARKAEAALGRAETLAEDRLRKLKEEEHERKAAQAEVDRVKEHFVAAAEAKARATEIEQKVAAMPTWRPVKGKGTGRGAAKMEWGTRVIIYSMLAMACPPAAVGAIIVTIVKRTAPRLDPVAPTARTVKDMRFELRLLEETLAGRRVAEAYRVRQLGFDETTKFQDPSMVTSVLVEPKQGAKPEVVILRAAYATGGGTSAHLVAAIEEKCFARLREFQIGWKAKCEEMFPNHAWTGPDPARCGLQALGGGGAVISDTCTPARCTQRLLAAEVAKQVQDKHPDWASLSEEEQGEAVRVHCQDCWNHIRNIFLTAMSKAQADHVKAALQEELEAFSAWERMTTDFDQLLRSVYKVSQLRAISPSTTPPSPIPAPTTVLRDRFLVCAHLRVRRSAHRSSTTAGATTRARVRSSGSG
jgi:hypothetical protein